MSISYYRLTFSKKGKRQIEVESQHERNCGRSDTQYLPKWEQIVFVLANLLWHKVTTGKKRSWGEAALKVIRWMRYRTRKDQSEMYNYNAANLMREKNEELQLKYP